MRLKYIIASAWIFGVIFIIGLTASIYKVLTDAIGGKKEQKARIKDTEKSIKALKGELDGYLLRQSDAKKSMSSAAPLLHSTNRRLKKTKRFLQNCRRLCMKDLWLNSNLCWISATGNISILSFFILNRVEPIR